MEQYNEFIKGLELKQIYLKNLSVERFMEPTEGDWVYNLSPRFYIKDNSEDGETVAENEFIAVGKFRIDTYNDKEKRKKMFSLTIEFNLKYGNNSEVALTDEIKEKFTSTSLPLNIWPYGRELISNMCLRMEYPALLIKTFKVY